jgi:hypothetical protein
MLGKFPGKDSFNNEMASPFSNSQIMRVLVFSLYSQGKCSVKPIPSALQEKVMITMLPDRNPCDYTVEPPFKIFLGDKLFIS